jgi:midasin
MNKKLVQPFMKDVKKEDITYVFIIVDSQQSSILGIKTIEYVEGKMKIKNYMSDFPFEYFLIINDVKELGEVLALTLLQFIQEK